MVHSYFGTLQDVWGRTTRARPRRSPCPHRWPERPRSTRRTPRRTRKETLRGLRCWTPRRPTWRPSLRTKKPKRRLKRKEAEMGGAWSEREEHEAFGVGTDVFLGPSGQMVRVGKQLKQNVNLAMIWCHTQFSLFSLTDILLIQFHHQMILHGLCTLYYLISIFKSKSSCGKGTNRRNHVRTNLEEHQPRRWSVRSSEILRHPKLEPLGKTDLTTFIFPGMGFPSCLN